MFYEVIPVGKVEVLTYSGPDSLLPGQIVMVPLGRRSVPGVVVKKVAQPDFATRKILKVLYTKPLPKHLLKTAVWMSEYYAAPLSSIIGMILPNGVLKQRRKAKTEQMFGNSDLGGSCSVLLSTGPVTASSPKNGTCIFGGPPSAAPPAHATCVIFLWAGFVINIYGIMFISWNYLF